MASFHVLLVDDEVAFLETLAKRLRKRNIDITLASSAQQALRTLRERPVDVVVLDLKMPGMDGIQAVREIKRTTPLVEVIMLTGHASVEAAIEGMELGAFDYLTKPVDIEELVYKLQDANRKKSIAEEKTRLMEHEGKPH
jgi:DNA-binding NtrC family response regulator